MRHRLLVIQYTISPEPNRIENTPKTTGKTLVMNCICEFTGDDDGLLCWRAIVWRAWYQPVATMSSTAITYGRTLTKPSGRASSSVFDRSIPRNRRPTGFL